MNANEIKGNWQVMKGQARAKWGKLTDQDMEVIAGKRDELVGHLRKYYGQAQGDVEQQVKEWEETADVPLGG